MKQSASQIRSLVIVGSGRSGTTWIQDVIASSENLKTVFEPLHPCVGEVARKYGNTYVNSYNREPVLNDFMCKVLSGRIKSLWIDYRSIPERLVPRPTMLCSPKSAYELYLRYRSLIKNYFRFKNSGHDGIVIKFIRANLMFEWMVNTFEFKSILVLRHPCAVVESKIRLGTTAKKAGLKYGVSDWDANSILKGFYENDDFRGKYIDKYCSDYNIANMNEVELQTLVWCLENKPAIDVCEKNNIPIICYENLVVNSDIEWVRISKALGLRNKINTASLNRPSQQASLDFQQTNTVEEKLGRWMHRFTDNDKKLIENMLKNFGLTIYSAYESMPEQYVNNLAIKRD